MNFIQKGVPALIAICLIGTLAAAPVVASQDIGIKASNAQGNAGETVTLEVAVVNNHEQAPAENITVAVDARSSDLAFNRTNTTVSIEPEEVKVITFEADIGENTDPGNYSVTAEALRGENSIDNTTAVVTVADSSPNRNTGNSGDVSAGSSEDGAEEKECTTIKDWIDGEIGFGEWDHWFDCGDDGDSAEDDSSWLDRLFD